MVRIVKKPEERREEIIEAARQLFLTRGYDNTTMRDVMRHLQIAKGTIYHYFKSKEELLEAVILYVAEVEIARQKAVLESSDGNALQRLECLIMSSANGHDEEGHAELLEHLHQTSNAGMHIKLLALLVTMQAPLYAQLFQQGCNEGLFSTDHPLECAELLLSGIQFLTDIGVYAWTQEQLLRRWRAFPAMLESQLNAPAGSFAFLGRLLQTPD